MSAYLLLPGGGGQVEIDEAGAGKLGPGDGVRCRHCLQQLLGQRARIGPGGLGQQHCRVGREIAVRTLLRALDGKVGRGEVGGQGAGGTQGGQALFDQGAELGFHEGYAMRFNGCALYAT